MQANANGLVPMVILKDVTERGWCPGEIHPMNMVTALGARDRGLARYPKEEHEAYLAEQAKKPNPLSDAEAATAKAIADLKASEAAKAEADTL